MRRGKQPLFLDAVPVTGPSADIAAFCMGAVACCGLEQRCSHTNFPLVHCYLANYQFPRVRERRHFLLQGLWLKPTESINKQEHFGTPNSLPQTDRQTSFFQMRHNPSIHKTKQNVKGNNNQLVHCKCQPIYVISFYSAFCIHCRVKNLNKLSPGNLKQGKTVGLNSPSPVMATVGCLIVCTLHQGYFTTSE